MRVSLVMQRQLSSNLNLSAMTGSTGPHRSDDSDSRSSDSSPHWTANDRQPPARIDIHEPRAYEPEPLLAEASFNDGVADLCPDPPRENGHTVTQE